MIKAVRSLSLKVLMELRVLKRPQKLTVLTACSFCLILNAFKCDVYRVSEDTLQTWEGAMQFIAENSNSILAEILSVASKCEEGLYNIETMNRIKSLCFGDLKEENLNPSMAVSRESKAIMQFVFAILQYVYALEAEKHGDRSQKRTSTSRAPARKSASRTTSSAYAPRSPSARTAKETPISQRSSTIEKPQPEKRPARALKPAASARLSFVQDHNFGRHRASFVETPKQQPLNSASMSNLHGTVKRSKPA